jgi:hypothetical protein
MYWKDSVVDEKPLFASLGCCVVNGSVKIMPKGRTESVDSSSLEIAMKPFQVSGRTGEWSSGVRESVSMPMWLKSSLEI